jgi:hypothetical protein
MGKFNDLTGQKFGMLTVINKSKKTNSNNQTYWDCSCDCNPDVIKSIRGDALRDGSTTSCGCNAVEASKKTKNKSGKIRYQDLVGQRFGNRVVIRKVQKPSTIKGEGTFWECVCDNGHTTIVNGGSLKNGRSCGECLKGEDLTGKKFGNRTAIKKVNKPRNLKGSGTYWECMCENGHVSVVREPDLTSGRLCRKCFKGEDFNGLITDKGKVLRRATKEEKEEKEKNKKKSSSPFWWVECSLCEKQRMISSKELKNNQICNCNKHLEFGEAAFNILYRQYKANAKERKFEFLLNKKDFKFLTNQDCYYCGSAPNQEIGEKGNYGKYIYNGIDRINNDEGYKIDNCVGCCGVCNKAKRIMSEEDFYELINLIYNKRLLNHNYVPNFNVNIQEINKRDLKFIDQFYKAYIYKAVHRNKSFNLTMEFFTNLIIEPCYYCGNRGKINKCNGYVFFCNGVDRKNNDLGYEDGNCVSCCETCNRAKLDMSEQEFYAWVFRVYHHIHRNDNITTNPEELNIQVSLPVYEAVQNQFQLV